ARGIAAGPRPAAVGVPEVERVVGALCRADLGELVKAHAAVPVPERGREPGMGYRPPPPCTDDHEVVARTVHLHERQACGGARLLHAAPYTRGPGNLPVAPAFALDRPGPRS